MSVRSATYSMPNQSAGSPMDQLATSSVRWQGNGLAAATSAVVPLFDPTGWCPAYEIPREIAVAVAEKNRRDESRMTELLSRGISAVPVQNGSEGGMETGVLAAT